jgi:hypothetical protein
MAFELTTTAPAHWPPALTTPSVMVYVAFSPHEKVSLAWAIDVEREESNTAEITAKNTLLINRVCDCEEILMFRELNTVFPSSVDLSMNSSTHDAIGHPMGWPSLKQGIGRAGLAPYLSIKAYLS